MKYLRLVPTFVPSAFVPYFFKNYSLAVIFVA